MQGTLRKTDLRMDNWCVVIPSPSPPPPGTQVPVSDLSHILGPLTWKILELSVQKQGMDGEVASFRNDGES